MIINNWFVLQVDTGKIDGWYSDFNGAKESMYIYIDKEVESTGSIYNVWKEVDR